jgi:hypothetical protein
MSVYSLVQPPKGSNVSGGKILHGSLLSKTSAAFSKSEKKGKSKQEILELISTFVENCTFDPSEEVQFSAEELESVVETQMAGYVAKIAKDRWCKSCQGCLSSVATATPRALPCYNLIKNRSYGYLTYPTEKLIKFICSLEQVILPILKAGLSSQTLNEVLTALLNSSVNEQLPLIGCQEHYLLLSQQLIYFYSTTRMYFASRVERLLNVSIEEAKSKSKQGKLITRPRPIGNKSKKSKNNYVPSANSQVANKTVSDNNTPGGVQTVTYIVNNASTQPPSQAADCVFVINLQ